MSDEKAIRDQLKVDRAERARKIVEDQLFVEAVAIIKAQFVENFQKTISGPIGRRSRDEIHRQFKSLDAVCDALRHEMESGKLAQHRIDEATKRKSR